jgi:predicted RNase H-like HicB family nuclease
MKTPDFVFTGLIIQEEKDFSSLCLELDIASQGETIQEAKDMLLEAVTLYLETTIESNLPHIRPVPMAEDPRVTSPEAVVEVFKIKVDIGVQVYA